jgi:hypothetical protein
VLALLVSGALLWIAMSPEPNPDAMPRPALSSKPDVSYRFVVAGDQLFAIENGGSYGTEQRLLTTDDLGATWREFDAPKYTVDVDGRDGDLVALTSRDEIWRKGKNDASWQRIRSSPGGREYSYDILLASTGEIIVTTKDAVTVYDSAGRSQRRYASPSADLLFTSARFAADDEQHVLVEASPSAVYVIDRAAQDMTLWPRDLEPLPENYSSICRIRRYGAGFLLSHPRGIYTAAGLLQPWKLLTDEISFTPETAFDGKFCRDLAAHDSAQDEWLVAADAGVQLMRGADKVKFVYEDRPGDHNLILQMTPYRGQYFVSFARLANGCIGIRIDADLEKWQPLRLR